MPRISRRALFLGALGGAAGAILAETKARYVINPPPDFVSELFILESVDTNKCRNAVTFLVY